jgi:uncharacterized protein
MAAQQAVLGRDEAKRLLGDCKQHIVEQYGVTALGLFGSVARNEATDGSDVDVVVQSDSVDLFTLVHIKEELEVVFHRPVDVLHYRDRMNPYLKRRIEQEAVYV